MAKRKRKKGQTMIHKTLHRKQKIEQQTTLKTGGEPGLLLDGRQFLFH